ncbi:unnamed protein product [Arabis nemorensis]|uniref:Uncharacterized protein n=1 Tax=Arabis nemorensis TaxID=586526 RepID=A0A565CIX5_9BRAS|nr:unnamed protein product [Arabis nemorensis]
MFHILKVKKEKTKKHFAHQKIKKGREGKKKKRASSFLWWSARRRICRFEISYLVLSVSSSADPSSHEVLRRSPASDLPVSCFPAIRFPVSSLSLMLALKVFEEIVLGAVVLGSCRTGRGGGLWWTLWWLG